MQEEKYWVTCTDKFMSGWGLAKNKISKMVCTVSTYADAERVESLWGGQSDKKYVNIRITEPRYPSHSYHTAYFQYNPETNRVVGISEELED